MLGVDVDLSDFNPVARLGLTGLISLFFKPFKIQDPTAMDLPPRDIGFKLAHLYFQITHIFIPICHCPTILQHLEGLYNIPGYTVSPAIRLQLNIIFAHAAQIYARVSAKSSGISRPSNHDVYFRRAMSFFMDMFDETAIENIQAVLLIMVYLHANMRSGALWHLSKTACALVLEMGLNRSDANRVHGMSPLDQEIRRRVFWSCVSMDRRISIALGRPIAIHDCDIGVDLPLCWDDQYLQSDSFRPPPPGTVFLLTPAYEIFRLAKIGGHVSDSLYSACKPRLSTYVEIIHRLEKELQQWNTQLCPAMGMF